MKSRSVPQHVIVVIWLTPGEVKRFERLPNYNPFQDPQFMDGTNRPDDADINCYVIAGDHSTRAVQFLHRKFPNNPLWQSMKVQVLILGRSEINYEHCLNMGNMDNQKNKSLDRSTLSVIRACRSVWMKLEEKSQQGWGVPAGENKHKLFTTNIG